MKKKMIFAGVTALLLMAVTAFAAALSGTTFGEATDLGGGMYRLVSDSDPGFGGINYNVPADLKFSNIDVLRTLQTAESGTCALGSPRFQLNVDTDGDGESDGNVFVYTQSFPSGCPADTGDLAGTGGPGDVAGVYDLSQIFPGTQVSTYTAAAALFAANPDYSIVGIQLVVDGGQTVKVTPTVEIILTEPANANSCKNGGWALAVRADGSPFKNQGDCIQYVKTGK